MVYSAERCAENVSNTTNVTENPWEYIQCFFGPQRQELWVAVSVTVINSIIFITGLLGNLAVCVVIFKQPTLHTATNYYLFNLAVSDVTLLIFGLPNDVALYWHQYPWSLGEAFCKIRALISETASYVSVLTIVAFSTERYIAICHPLHVRAVSGLRRAVWAVVGLWIGSLCAAMPFAVHSRINYVFYPWYDEGAPIKESAMCAMTAQPDNIPLTEMSTIIFFIIPMVIIAVQYINMAITISRTTNNTLGKRINGSVHRTHKKVQTNKNVIRMLAFVVLGFFVCWAPFHAQRLVAIYFRDTEYFDELNYWMYCITGLFYYFSSTLNPILYNVMSDRMRNAFKEVFLGTKPNRRIVKNNSTYRDVSHTYLSHQNSTMNTNCFNDDEERAQLVKKEDGLLHYTPNRENSRSFYGHTKVDYSFLSKKNNETCI